MTKSPFAGVKSSAMRTQLPFGSSKSVLEIGDIINRPSGDTRPLNPRHIESLAESIAALGLIQPIAVDREGHLLAGGHRKAAIEYLKETNFDAYLQHFSNGVPIHRYDFDAEKEPNLALAIETTENEKRRDYTPSEVRELAERLKAAGFHYTRGRAVNGQKSLAPTLANIVGKSTRTVERYLAGQQELNPTDDGFERSKLNPTDDGFSKQLSHVLKAIRKLKSTPAKTKVQKELVKDLLAMIERIEQALD